MFLFLKFCFLFSVGAAAGWVIEFIFRHFLTRQWVNPGFLNGPWLPLYGFGTVILYLFSALPLDPFLRIPGIIVSMTLLELIAGLIFTSLFHIRLWDYSDEWLNFKGLICPLYSFFWGILGMIFVYLIYPFLRTRLNFLMDNLHLSFFLGIFNGFFLVDLFSALGILTLIREGLADTETVVKKMLVNYEKLKIDLRKWLRENSLRTPGGRFLAPFQGHVRPGVKKLILEQAVKKRDDLLKRIPLKRKSADKKAHQNPEADQE